MKSAIIIGAGPAGVTAGYELKKQMPDMDVTILEETNDIGGISRTVRYKGNRMDIGGHRFFSKDTEVTNWWTQIMPKQGAKAYDDLITGREVLLTPGGPDPENEDRVMLTRRRVSRIFYRKKFFDYPIKMNAQTIRNMGFFTTMAAGFSYLASCLVKRQEDCLENFYVNRFGKKLYSMFFEGYTEKLWGRHPREISADWGAQRVKGLSILAILKDMWRKTFSGKKNNQKVETSLIEEFGYPKYGPGQLWETAAADFIAMGGHIEKGCKVENLEVNNHRVNSVKAVKNGETIQFQGDYVFSTMPIKDLVQGINDVPPNVAEVAAGLPYRDFVTIGLLLPKLNLKNTTSLKTLSDLVPDCWIYVQDAGVKLGRIQIFNNWSPYLVEKPEDTVWIGLEYFCAEGDEYWNMSEIDWVAFASKELKSMGVIDEDSKIMDYHKESVKKAYPAYFDTYDRIDEVISYLNEIDNLYCIGRNGQHRYNNMDHSMATAFEAVRNIKNGVHDKSNIWSVNTDSEYHEENSTDDTKSADDAINSNEADKQ